MKCLLCTLLIVQRAEINSTWVCLAAILFIWFLSCVVIHLCDGDCKQYSKVETRDSKGKFFKVGTACHVTRVFKMHFLGFQDLYVT